MRSLSFQRETSKVQADPHIAVLFHSGKRNQKRKGGRLRLLDALLYVRNHKQTEHPHARPKRPTIISPSLPPFPPHHHLPTSLFAVAYHLPLLSVQTSAPHHQSVVTLAQPGLGWPRSVHVRHHRLPVFVVAAAGNFPPMGSAYAPERTPIEGEWGAASAAYPPPGAGPWALRDGRTRRRRCAADAASACGRRTPRSPSPSLNARHPPPRPPLHPLLLRLGRRSRGRTADISVDLAGSSLSLRFLSLSLSLVESVDCRGWSGMEVFGCGNGVVDAEFAEVDPTGRYMRVSSLSSLSGFILSLSWIRITF
jgi:hypothetical protein